MKIAIDSGLVTISGSGVAFLKLKTLIAKRLGNVYKEGRDFVTLPVSTLPLIQDLIEGDKTDKLIKYIEPFEKHSMAREKAIAMIETESTDGVTTPWIQLLDPAQSTAVAAMVLPDLLGLCLFDEQGSGKTVMSIAAFDILKDANIIDRMIVVCPKSMVGEWPKDISRFTKDKHKVVLAEGDKRQKYDAALEEFDVLVTNYEGVEVMLTSLVASSQMKKHLLVVDESYYLKNSETIRAEIVMKLRAYCNRCFVLCGTPAPNSAYDLVNQFNLADLGYTFGGFSKSKDQEKDLENISKLLDDRGLFIRRLKDDILKDIPTKDFHVVSIELIGKQALMYDKARSELELELKTFNNETFRKHLATYFQRRSILLQICSCPGSIDPTFSDIPAKYIALDELLDRLIKENRKVVIWTFFKNSIDELYMRYAHFNPVKIDGRVYSTSARRAAVTAFQEDPKTMLFIGNPAAAGAGITLHAAYDAVYVSYSNQAAHYLQSLDRIHRRGQISSHVNYYLFACKGTIEETEIVRLRGKEIRQHNILGDHISWPTSLDDALRELTAHA